MLRRLSVLLVPLALLAGRGVEAQPAPQSAPPPAPAAQTRPFAVVNASAFVMYALYVWPRGAPSRGEDRLGTAVLPARRGWPMDLPTAAGCQWQVAATYTDTTNNTRREGRTVDVDTCATPELRLPPAPGLVQSGGTGFVVSAAGHIVTNRHVVDGCGYVGLRQRGRDDVRLRLLGTAQDADLALLQAPGPIGTPLPLRERGKAPRLGEPFVVLGYRELFTFGGQILALTGRVVARQGQDIGTLGRLDVGDAGTFLHDARTWGGNSGGPLIDYTGSVMGIHVARTSHPGTKDEPVVPLAIGIRVEHLYDLLARYGVRPLPEPPRRAEPEILVEEAEPSVLRLLCFSG